MLTNIANILVYKWKHVIEANPTYVSEHALKFKEAGTEHSLEFTCLVNKKLFEDRETLMEGHKKGKYMKKK